MLSLSHSVKNLAKTRTNVWWYVAVFDSRCTFPFIYHVVYHLHLASLLGRPEPPFRRGLCFTADVFFSLGRQISAVPRPIAAKLCHMIAIWWQLLAKVGQLGGPPLKYFRGQKHAKFRSIFCNVRLSPRISPERLKISKS